jgi:hypothetical protein
VNPSRAGKEQPMMLAWIATVILVALFATAMLAGFVQH